MYKFKSLETTGIVFAIVAYLSFSLLDNIHIIDKYSIIGKIYLGNYPIKIEPFTIKHNYYNELLE